MLEAPSRLLRLIKLAAGLVLLVVLAGPYLRDGPSVAQVREQVLEQYAEVLRSFQDEKKLFVADFLGGGVALEGTGLAALCASRTWFPDDKAVIVSCEPSSGGPGAVKNGLLSCIRFAIEVGGEFPSCSSSSSSCCSLARGLAPTLQHNSSSLACSPATPPTSST